MKKAANDNSETWQPISLAAGRLLVKLGEQKKSDREREAQRTDNDEQKKEDERAYIEQRLKDIAAFEDRLRPGYRSRRKRN